MQELPGSLRTEVRAGQQLPHAASSSHASCRNAAAIAGSGQGRALVHPARYLEGQAGSKGEYFWLDQVCLYTCGDLIASVPFFEDAEEGFTTSIVTLLRPTVRAASGSAHACMP